MTKSKKRLLQIKNIITELKQLRSQARSNEDKIIWIVKTNGILAKLLYSFNINKALLVKAKDIKVIKRWDKETLLLNLKRTDSILALFSKSVKKFDIIEGEEP